MLSNAQAIIAGIFKKERRGKALGLNGCLVAIGGMSGPAVKPLALRMVWQVAHAVNIPVVGLGGIMKETTPSDGEEMGTYILGYDLSSQGGARMRETGPDGYPVPDLVLAATDRIQGMTVLQDHSILLSQSYGRKNPSALLHYAAPEKEGQKTAFSVGSAKVEGYVLDSRLLLENITAPPMTEAVAALPGGIVQVNFESGAMRYDDGRDRTDQLWRMKLE